MICASALGKKAVPGSSCDKEKVIVQLMYHVYCTIAPLVKNREIVQVTGVYTKDYYGFRSISFELSLEHVYFIIKGADWPSLVRLQHTAATQHSKQTHLILYSVPKERHTWSFQWSTDTSNYSIHVLHKSLHFLTALLHFITT